MDDKFVVTGGCKRSWGKICPASKKVAKYTEAGEVTFMPSMKSERYRHACSKFVNDDGDTVSIIDMFVL